MNNCGSIVGTATNTITGGPLHGVMLIPDQITRDNNPINSTNNTVVIGQQMNLTNMISGVPTNAITYWKWSIPGANGNTNTDTAIYDYEPNTNNSNYTNLVTPTNYLTNSSGIPFCNFFFTAPGTNQVSCTTVIYGQTNTVSATLNVLGPPNARMTANTNAAAPIAVDGNYFRTNPPTWLHFGQAQYGMDGITFSQANSNPSGVNGNFTWVQVINSDLAAITNATSGTVVHTTSGFDSEPYPYDTNTPTSDSPASPLLSTGGDQGIYRRFVATMYLTWQATNLPSGDKTVPVPLRAVAWNWSGSATNSASGSGSVTNSTFG